MTRRVVALSGGVGGAKLALGLSQVLDTGELLIVANTGDDFEHLGFLICPDIDTLLYTLGGVSNVEQGWGRANETWQFMETLRKEQPDQAWFQLGDKDLDTHRYRTAALASGASLSEVTAQLTKTFGITADIVPMTDDPVRTHVLAEKDSREQWLPFQEYFVRDRCEPRTKRIEFRGRERASVSSRLVAALDGESIAAVVLCPSNPYLSIDPILAIPGLPDMLRSCGAPVVAVSPVIGGKALKGPTAKIMRELGLQVNLEAIAGHYRDVIDGLVLDVRDSADAQRVEALGVRTLVTNSVMNTLQDRIRLARDVLRFAATFVR